jgi:Fe-S-cluster containining protein
MKTADDMRAIIAKAPDWRERNAALVKRLKRKKPTDLDAVFHAAHDQAFAQMDCLQCANCCKTTSPLLLTKDIEQLAQHLRMKPGAFEERYVRVDEDGDKVFQSAPCPFLGADNHCSVYAARPKACREYPHTNRKKVHHILDLTLANALICPAVDSVLHQARKHYFGE